MNLSSPLKIVTLLLFFVSSFSFAQIDYNGLVRNLEEITKETDFKVFFKDLPVEINDEVSYNDERFLRYYGITVDKMEYRDGWNASYLELTFFNKASDYKKLVSKLTEVYGDTRPNNQEDSIGYAFGNDQMVITFDVELKDGVFSRFTNALNIKFK